MDNDDVRLAQNGHGAAAYADAVATYLACAVSRSADYWSSLAVWAGDFVAHTFGRQALSMIWDYAEANPFSNSTGNWSGATDWVARVVERLPAQATGYVVQRDARTAAQISPIMISTDPPYYDNVGYADLPDFFYVWLRRAADVVNPQLFATLLTAKLAF